MIKDSLYMAFISQISYSNYIEGKTDVVEGETDFELLLAIYAGFLYTTLFEDYFTVSGDKVNTSLTDKYLERLIKGITTVSDKGYTFGEEGINLGYNTKELAFYKIRNKIAHGDFYVEDGNIIFEEKGIKGIINLSNFIGMLTYLEESGANNKKYVPGRRLIYINKNNGNSSLDERNIDKLSRKIHQIEMIDRPISLRSRNDDYVGALDELYNRSRAYISSNPKLPIEKYISALNNLTIPYKEKYGIEVSYSATPLYALPEYKEIKEKFLNKNERIKETLAPLDVTNQTILLSHSAYEISNENRITIRKGILLNLVILDELNKNPNQTIMDIICGLNEKIAKLMLTNMDDIIVMSFLVGFYSLFQYGLETSLTTANERKMYEIYDGSKLDFSKLNVDSLETETRVNEKTKLKTDYPDSKLKQIDSAKKKFEKFECAYKTVLTKNDPLSEKAIMLKDKLNEAAVEYDEVYMNLQQDINKYLNFVYNFELEKYTNNLDIIYHIRNAISHGNIRIVKYGKNIIDTIIRITDKTDGRTGDIVYDKELTVEEFNKIFSGNNVYILNDFLSSNIESKEEKVLVKR